MSKRLHLSLVLILIISLAACNMPSATNSGTNGPNAIFTAAAQTIEVQLTSNAQTQAVAVTNTPLPAAATATLTPTASVSAIPTATVATKSAATCDQALFISDVTVSDGTNFAADESFTKTWRIKNTGTCAWTTAYSLVFVSGDSMSGVGSKALTGTVNAGDTVDISVDLKAPSSSGSYTGKWALRNPSGSSFTAMTVVINVGGNDGGKFTVLHAVFSSTGGCNGFNVTVVIETNGAGTVTYHWIRSDGATDTATHAPLVYNAAGTQSVSTSWTTTAAGAKWIDIYIDSPNHQQLGRAEFTCP